MYGNKNLLSWLWAYARQHWFKLSLLLLILVFVFKKEFNINFGFGSKAAVETQNDANKDNRMTDVSEQNTAENIPLSIFNMFGNDDKKTELPTLDKATKAAYLKRFAKVAIAEKEKYGIPASLILANALHQSFAGTRSAALQANNHFGLPCSENWAGTTATLDGACVRKYENAWSSFRDHSLLLSSGKFGQLKQFGNKDYKAWAKGLQKLGYPSVNSDYLAADLVAIIETWGLARLDDL